MIDQLIAFSVRNRLIVLAMVLAMATMGLYALSQLAVDAVPDITNNQVQVITQAPSLAPQEVERFITFPLELALANIQRKVEMRSISRYGLSIITLVFEDDMDILKARQLVSEQLRQAEEQIPASFGRPELMPITTGLGEIYQYTLRPQPGYEQRYAPMELRTIHDWIVKRYMSGIKGIAEISSFGGFIKQYEVALDPDRLRSTGVTMQEIFTALETANQNIGGSYIEKHQQAYYIRAEGLLSGIEDIGQVVIAVRGGIPVLVRDVAQVREGHPPRFGAMTIDGTGEAVGGITLMLKGANSSDVIAAVKDRVAQVQKLLPEGLEIVPYLDRSDLVGRTIRTVSYNLTEGGLIVIFVLVLLLGNWRAGLVVASVIPLALLFAFSMMWLFGVSANLMSLGAIDFGLVVDGAIIIVEASLHRLHHAPHLQGISRLSREELHQEVTASSINIRKSAAFGEIIILMVYVPILALSGIEGKMFQPMAQTVGFAIMGALLLSMTYVPMMTAWCLSGRIERKANFADKLIGALFRLYAPLRDGALGAPRTVLAGTGMLFITSLWLFARMGGEFIPTLDEGDLACQQIVPAGTSLSESIRTSLLTERVLMDSFPDEVRRVVAKIGTAEVPTDPMGVEDADIMILLHPPDRWRQASSREELAGKMKKTLEKLIGWATYEFSQPIQLRFNELLTGAKTDIAVKIFGEDLEVLAQKGVEAARLIAEVQGAADVRVEQTEGMPQWVVNYRREKLAQYNLSVSEVNRLIRTAFAGEVSGLVFEGEKRFELAVRLLPNARGDMTDLKALYVTLPNNSQVPLQEIADIRQESGTSLISREEGKRRIVIGVNVRQRDIASLVAEIEQMLQQKLQLPPGYQIHYGGQFEHLQAAQRRLSIAVPAALGAIFMLLYFTFGSVRQSLMVFSAVPLSAIGGIAMLWLRGMPFSISAGVGFIALFGVAVLNGIVLIGHFNELKRKGINNALQIVQEGTQARFRPVITTALVAALGFLPMALSGQAGAEVQRPLASVVIGGLFSATLLTLVVLPVLYTLVNQTSEKHPAQPDTKAPKHPNEN